MRIKVPSACAVTVVVFAACLVPLSSTSADPDLWGHIRFGQDMLRDRSIATTDPYSYMTADSHWINHEWLAESIFAAFYERAGATGLIVLKSALAMLLAGTVFAFLRSQGLPAVRAGLILFVVLSGMQTGLGTLRPQLFTYIAFAALLLVIHAAERERPRWLLALPALFVVWVNLHGGVLAGVVVLALWLGIRLWRSGRNAVRRGGGNPNVLVLVLIAATCGLALLLNPYGYRLLLFLFRTATVSRPEVAEWVPLHLATPSGAVYLVLVGLTVAGLALAPQRRNVTAVVLCVMAVAPLVAMRHLPLFALTVAFFAGPLIADAWERWKPGVAETRMPGWIALAFIAIAAWCVYMASPNFRCIRRGEGYPAQAVDLLRRSTVTGNLATSFNWGEYIIWHLGPAVRVSVDGRRETVYSSAAYRQAYDFWSGRGDWEAVLRAGADFALVEKDGAASNLLRLRQDWVLAHEDEVSRLFVRRGSPQSDILARTIPSTPAANAASTCFP